MTNIELLKYKRYTPYSQSQNLNHMFYSYTLNKLKEFACLCDIDNTIRFYQTDVKGDITETLIKQLLDYFNCRLRLVVIIINNKAYYLKKTRIGKDEFKKEYYCIDKTDIPYYKDDVNNLITEFY